MKKIISIKFLRHFLFSPQNFFSTQKTPECHLNSLYSNFSSCFLPQNYRQISPSWEALSYDQMMSRILDLSLDQSFGLSQNENQIGYEEASFLCSRILSDRGEFENAIAVLYALDQHLSEVMISSQYQSGLNVEHNLNLTNSLLEASYLYGRISDISNQMRYLQLAEEQLVDFLGTNEQRIELQLKFFASYVEFDPDKAKEKQLQILELLDRMNNSSQILMPLREMLSVLLKIGEKQAAVKLATRLMAEYGDKIKEDLEREIIPELLGHLRESREAEQIRETAQRLKIEVNRENQIKRKVQDMLQTAGKLKQEQNLLESISITESALKALVEESPEAKIDPTLLLTIFNNLFVLHALQGNTTQSIEFGNKWAKLADKLNNLPQVITAHCSLAAFFLRKRKTLVNSKKDEEEQLQKLTDIQHKEYEQSLDLARFHSKSAMKVIEISPSSFDSLDKFIANCLFTQTHYNQEIKLESTLNAMKEATKSPSSLLAAKVGEMLGFLKENNAKKENTKPFAQQFLELQSILGQSPSLMSCIAAQDLAESCLYERDYVSGEKWVSKAISFYEVSCKDQKDSKPPSKRRITILLYLKACIKIGLHDVESAFNTIHQVNTQSAEPASKKNALQFWENRLQASLFLHLGQLQTALPFATKAVESAKNLKDFDATLDAQSLEEKIMQLQQQLKENETNKKINYSQQQQSVYADQH